MSVSIPNLLAATLLAACLSFGPAHAQPAVQPDPGRVSLDVVVSHKSGKPIAGLHQQDFTLFDNNSARPITGFSVFGGPQAPVEIILVIDAVNTDFSDLAREREQIDAFLKSNGGHLAHPVTLAIFTDNGIEMQQTPSRDGNQLSAALDQSPIGLREIRRTSQYEANDRVNLSIGALESLVEKQGGHSTRQLIFWISPGWPLLSGPRVDLDASQQQQIYSQVIAISDALRRNNMTLYSIDPLGTGQNVEWEFAYQAYLKGVEKPGQVEIGDLALQVIATQSGGLALSASNDTVGLIERCMDDSDVYYHIIYETPPPERANEYHRVDVKVSTPGVIARTRTGYYANTSPVKP